MKNSADDFPGSVSRVSYYAPVARSTGKTNSRRRKVESFVAKAHRTEL